MNADIQSVGLGIKLKIGTAKGCGDRADGSLLGYSRNEQAYPNTDEQVDEQPELPEYLTSSAAEARESYNYYQNRAQEKLVKSSNPFFNAQRKGRLASQSPGRGASDPRASSSADGRSGSQLAARRR